MKTHNTLSKSPDSANRTTVNFHVSEAEVDKLSFEFSPQDSTSRIAAKLIQKQSLSRFIELVYTAND